VRRFLKLSECKHFFFFFFFFEKKIKIFLKQTEFVCVCHVCVCVLLENTASSFFCSGLDARERVRLKKITARRRVFHRRRACYNGC